jgi:2-methylcitrate dehydratase PrpD
MSKHLHPGKAAFNGVLSADLARVGFTGATRILEGDRGFFAATSASHDASRIVDGLGSTWKIVENCYKLHSCCGHTHSAIDVAIDLRNERGWSDRRAVTEIDAIHIETYGPGFEIVKEMNPRTPYQAKFSIAYGVAVGLLEGAAGLAQFASDRFGDDGVRDAAIATLLQRTRVVVADDLSAKYPAAWPTRLAVTLRNGETVRGASDFPRGNPENPVSTPALEQKFMALVTPRFGDAVAERAVRAIRDIESCADMASAFHDLP